MRRSGPGAPTARKQVLHPSQAVALAAHGGWSGGGQKPPPASSGKRRQHWPTSGLIQPRKSSSQEAAGLAMKVRPGERAASDTCRTPARVSTALQHDPVQRKHMRFVGEALWLRVSQILTSGPSSKSTQHSPCLAASWSGPSLTRDGSRPG